jgi:hypothetical protein
MNLQAPHLFKSRHGIWYVRIVVPRSIRQRHPELPGELKRSTETSVRRVAEASSKKMCVGCPARWRTRTPGHERPLMQGRFGASQLVGWAIVPRKRVFDLDLEHCPNCGGELKIIAAILETAVIERILEHLGLSPTGLLRWDPI